MKFSAYPAGGVDCRWQKGWRTLRLAGLIALGVAVGGCQSAPLQLSLLQRSYRPNNIFVYPPKLTTHLQRVAVLPMAAETADSGLPEGCAALTPVLWQQLIKTKRFEVVAVDSARLRSGTGQANWTGAETLPPDFFPFLRREYDCDAVLFAELTTYRAYAPLAVGWRLKLVDTHSGLVIWSADELFDASRADVAFALQRFVEPGMTLPFCRENNWVAMNSPSEFGRYSAAALLNTLPTR